MGTLIIGTIVLGTFAYVGYSTIKKKKKGGSSCGSCSGCPSSSYCHEAKK